MIGTSRSGSSSSSITCCSTTLVCGELPDGRPDVSWCGRKGERNALFADSLVCTGMRLGEGSSLLVTGVPPPGPRPPASEEGCAPLGGPPGSAQRVHQGGDVGIQPLRHGSRRQLCPSCLPPWLRHQLHFL